MTVTIIGAGIVGCALAYELASRGAAVLVLDPRGVGRGATRASAGILAPRIEGHSDALLQLSSCSLRLYDEFTSRVRADGGSAFDYERAGTLQVALGPAQVPALRAASTGLFAAGVPHVLVEGSDVQALEPALSGRAAAGLLVPEHGYIDPDAFTLALAEAAAKRGATFLTARVDAVRDDGGRPGVSTDAGTRHADAVIVAAGSWTSDLTAPLSPVKPIRGQLLHLRTERRPASRVIWGERCYVVARSDGSVLVGATVEDAGFDETATAAGVHGLLDAAVELMPALGRARFTDVRVGLRPLTGDELPAVGRSSTMPGVYYAVGHYRNGVLLAPLTARWMADLVLDGREAPDLALVRPDRLGL